MEPIDLVKRISKLMTVHKVPFHVENEWVVPHGRLPALRGTWYPGEQTGRLEIDVLLDDNRIINECFAGIGDGSNGINDALQNFCVNSYHVLLSAFWYNDDPEQVITEKWIINGKSFKVFIGNFGTRGSDGVTPEIPHNLFESIEYAIKNETLDNKISWFRCFFCDVAGAHTFEALKDNEVWEPGLKALKSLPWKCTNGYYSVRNFIVLIADV
jgi:hypothetical protein